MKTKSANNIIYISDALRESRIQSMIRQLRTSSDRLERRMICARLECELKHRSHEEVRSMELRMGLM